jgi:thiol-disulfide isomerase/thioredoxin
MKAAHIAAVLFAAAAVVESGAGVPVGSTTPTQPATATSEALLDVGDVAPRLELGPWLAGKPWNPDEADKSGVVVLVFWATWSGPARAALPALVSLHKKYHPRGVRLIGITAEPEEAVREFLDQYEPPLPFSIALDKTGKTTESYCGGAGVNFVPYCFLVGPDRTIAWHGHPEQPELVQFIEQLLSGTFDRAAARESVRKVRRIDQLETLFRDSCEQQAWRTALLALDQMLELDVPKERPLRYKLTILLGELDDVEAARRLASELAQRYASNARLLNRLAWDLVSEPRLYLKDPEIGFRLAKAAYQACGGQDAAVADTYARALHVIGRTDLALVVQQRAVEAAGSNRRQAYQRMLDFYRRCQELQASASAEP